MSALVSTTSPPAASIASISALSKACLVPLPKKRILGRRPVSRASVRMRSPSAKNSPVSRRCFLSRRARTSLTSGFEKAVIARGKVSLLPELFLDQPDEGGERFLGAFALGADGDRLADRGAEHHQPHDRSAGYRRAVLLHLDAGGEARGERDELGARAGVQAALVEQGDGALEAAQTVSPRISDATEIYLRPASRAAATAARTSIVFLAPSSRISIGRLTPAITSIFSDFISEMARLEGVPPNKSVRMMTPPPSSTRPIASAMSRRRPSMSSSGPMQIASTRSCGPTTCSIAVTNSAARRPWVTSTSPIIQTP